MAKKPTIKGTTVNKKLPKQTSVPDRRNRVLNFSNVEDVVADIREVYFDKKRAQQSGSTDAKGLAKTKRDERLAVTGMEESRARRTATSGMNANEARKALAEELKRRIKN